MPKSIDRYMPEHFEPHKTGDYKVYPHGHVYPDLTFDRKTCKPFMSFVSLAREKEKEGNSLLAIARRRGVYHHNYLAVGVEDENGNKIFLGAIGKQATPGTLEAIAMDGLWSTLTLEDRKLDMTPDSMVSLPIVGHGVSGKIAQENARWRLSGQRFIRSHDIKMPAIAKAAIINAEHDCMMSVSALESTSKMSVNHKTYRISWDEAGKLLAKANDFYTYYQHQDPSLVAASFMTTYQFASDEDDNITFKHQSNETLFAGTLARLHRMRDLSMAFAKQHKGEIGRNARDAKIAPLEGETALAQAKQNAFVVNALLMREVPLAISACMHARVKQAEFERSTSCKKRSSMSLDNAAIEQAVNNQLDAVAEVLQPLVKNQAELDQVIEGFKTQLNDSQFADKMALINAVVSIYLSFKTKNPEGQTVPNIYDRANIFFATLATNIMAADLNDGGNPTSWMKLYKTITECGSDVGEIEGKRVLKNYNARGDFTKYTQIQPIIDQVAAFDMANLPTSNNKSVAIKIACMAIFSEFSDENCFRDTENKAQLEAVHKIDGGTGFKFAEKTIASLDEYIERNKKYLDITKEGGCPYPEGFTQEGSNDCRRAAVVMAREAIGFEDSRIADRSELPLVETAGFDGRVLKNAGYSIMEPKADLRNELNRYQYELFEYLYKMIYRDIGKRALDETKAMKDAYHELRLNLQRYKAGSDGGLNLLTSNVKPLSIILTPGLMNDAMIQAWVAKDDAMRKYIVNREVLRTRETTGNFAKQLVKEMDALFATHPEQIETLAKVADAAQKITADGGNTEANQKICSDLVKELGNRGSEWHRVRMTFSFVAAIGCGASAAIVAIPPLTVALAAVSLYALWTSVDQASKITPAAEEEKATHDIAEQLSKVCVNG